jgi:hypothetical protein
MKRSSNRYKTAPSRCNTATIAPSSFRTVTDLDTYAAALQTAGIPYLRRGAGVLSPPGNHRYAQPPAVVDNRGNETALAGVLRSPLFLCSPMPPC